MKKILVLATFLMLLTGCGTELKEEYDDFGVLSNSSTNDEDEETSFSTILDILGQNKRETAVLGEDFRVVYTNQTGTSEATARVFEIEFLGAQATITFELEKDDVVGIIVMAEDVSKQIIKKSANEYFSEKFGEGTELAPLEGILWENEEMTVKSVDTSDMIQIIIN